MKRRGDSYDDVLGRIIDAAADAGAVPPLEDVVDTADPGETTTYVGDASVSVSGRETRPTPSDGEDDRSPAPDADADLAGIERAERIIETWEPNTEADTRRAREDTRRAVEWLRDSGGRRSRSEFTDALADESPLSARSFWERAVQPGLRRLVDADLVEYRPGHHDYHWVGDDGE